MVLQVEWYAANPGYHQIPPGYGLPWGTNEEDRIPGPLIFEAELALARAQLKTQTPAYEKLPLELPSATPISGEKRATSNKPEVEGPKPPPEWNDPRAGQRGVRQVQHTEPAEPAGMVGPVDDAAGLPPDWPDPRGFIPPPPRPQPPTCWPSDEPVIRHTRLYNGHDGDFTEALASYYYFRNDARFGGWQSYLQRSDDFIRFCCHLHIAQTLTARGGAGETRVVWRWPKLR
jgi:hypothetical protein